MESINIFQHELISGVNSTALALMIMTGYVATQILGLHYCRPFQSLKKTRKALVVALSSLLISIAYMADGVLSWEHALTTFAMANTLYATTIKNFLSKTNNHDKDQAKSSNDSSAP